MSRVIKRIVFLNRSYWPDIEATGQLLTDLCESLAHQFDVHVICGQPNSPEPNAKFLPVGQEHRNGVTIHRLAHHKFQKKNPVGRVLNLMSFSSAVGNYLRMHDPRADLVISETDPFLLPITGAEYAQRTGASHCVYLQDIYPDVAEGVGKIRMPMVSRSLRGRLRKAYSEASKVIVLGRCMRQRLIEQPWGLDPDKIEIIPNWSDCRKITPVDHSGNRFRRKLGLQDRFVVMHSGNMGLTQCLDVLIEAAADPAWPERAKLLLVGNGASRDRLIQHRQRLGLTDQQVEFVNYQPRHRLAESLGAADVHVVSMHPGVTGCLCPSKLYGIMAAGRGIIAIAESKTDLSQTVSEHDLGWCVEPGMPSSIASAVAQAEAESTVLGNSQIPTARQMRSRRLAEQRFDGKIVAARFTRAIRGILSGSGRVGAIFSPDQLDLTSLGRDDRGLEIGL